MLWATIVLNLGGATCLFAPSAGATTVAPTVASAGPSFPDRDTVGLWLFDELTYPHTTLTDASEYAKADLCLMDGGTMVPGKYGQALQFSGTNYAVCYAGFAGKVPEDVLREKGSVPSGLWGPTEGSGALLGGLSGKTWTIEFWINLAARDGSFTIFDLGQGLEPGVTLQFNNGALTLIDSYAGIQAICPTKLAAGQWQHVAFTRDGTTVRHFLDGVEQGVATVSSVTVQPTPDLQQPTNRASEHRGFKSMNPEQRRQNRFNFAIGSDRQAGQATKGMMDELRVSRVVRYRAPFTPGSFSRNFGASARPPSRANGPALLFDPKPSALPLNFGARKHVFIDDIILDTRTNVQITLNQPFGKEPLGAFLEVKKSAWRPSVFDVDGAVFMAIPESYSSKRGVNLLATSPDGLNFTMKGPIIPETPMYGAFFKDLNPQVPPAELYKVNAFVGNRGTYFYVSGDGINWRRNETIQLPLRSGGGAECYWDDQRGLYQSFTKRDSSFRVKSKLNPDKEVFGHKAAMFRAAEALKPWPFNALQKPYFEGYPFPAVTDEGAIGIAATTYGGVYRSRAIKYPWAPDTYLAFIWRYPGNDKARHVELAVSRNGQDWTLFGTNWYVPTGTADEELAAYGLIRRGDELWQYVDEGGAHGGSALRTYYRYKQRLDGFTSLDAGKATGVATTLPLVIEGRQLLLNVNATGGVKVAILDSNGKELPGFGLADCDAIRGDFVAQQVTWRGLGDVSGLKGKAVRLKLEMQAAKLFAFEFAR